MLGKGSISHNSRKFKAANVDSERTSQNITYYNEPIKDVYHKLFDEALDRYNAKQKRADRRIDNYYEKIRTGKQEKLFYEVILQIGNNENMSAISGEGQLAAKVLNAYMEDFQKRNPNLYIFSAHLHMDEATPHLHIDFVPFTTGSKRGLDTRVSLKKALADQGFAGGARGETEWNQWVHSEKEQLSQAMEHHGIEWEQLGTHDEHLSVMNYKKEERAKEIKQLANDISAIQKKKLNIKSVQQIDVKNVPLSTKVMLSREDFVRLSTAAKKYIAQEKNEGTLKKLLKAAERTIAELKSKVMALTQELNKYRSIREQLDVGTLKQKNKDLLQNNDFYKSIIMQHGLGHLLRKNKDVVNKDDTIN
ncbi:MAG: recombinase [Clostridiales bacterium]|nr:recombinase [Clostridiales bacterium]